MAKVNALSRVGKFWMKARHVGSRAPSLAGALHLPVHAKQLMQR